MMSTTASLTVGIAIARYYWSIY